MASRVVGKQSLKTNDGFAIGINVDFSRTKNKSIQKPPQVNAAPLPAAKLVPYQEKKFIETI